MRNLSTFGCVKTTLDIERFKTKLRSKGLRSTPQRLAVHEAMAELGHASADMVCEWIKSHSQASITVASVYNILSQMANLGFYKRLFSANNKMFFDVMTGNHLHLYDIVNHEFTDVIDEDVNDYIAAHFKRKRFKGYRLEDINIQIVCRPYVRKTKEQ